MRRLFMSVAAAAILIGAAASAKADLITVVRTKGTFSYSDYQPWAEIGVNNSNVTNGTVAMSKYGTVSTTIDFAQGGPGSTQLECPWTGCTWTGNFGPGDSVLTSINANTGGSEGAIDLTFSQGVAGVGFQIQGKSYGTFDAEIEAFDGSTPLGTFYAYNGNSNGNENGSAIFMGLQDLSGANITGIDILAYNCSGTGGGSCDGTAIDRLLFETTATPEPATLLLLGSGLTALGFLRRKLLGRS